MTADSEATARQACRSFAGDRERLVEICRAVQAQQGHVDDDAIEAVADELGVPRVHVQSVVTFYSLLSLEPVGRTVIRLCNDVPDMMAGAAEVAEALTEELGIGFGEVTPDGALGLQWTACIGMSDQAPAALVDDVVVTDLTPETARDMARKLRSGTRPKDLVDRLGDGNNAHEHVGAMVRNNLRRPGPVIFGDWHTGAGLHRALSMSPVEVIKTVKTARLRGRGGAGFPTGMKWEFARGAQGSPKYILCNADEGEPGTFKDRVILTECPEMMFEGMAIAGYAVGAEKGVVYLRAEYDYLRRFLEHALARQRYAGLLGADAGGRSGFHFDIEIRTGAGSYVCGEETALISSIEGWRGDPKTRPPFPAQEGYRALPSVVNNVETFCCATRILEEGPGWFSQLGSPASPGTKLLSISGDCRAPGVYEFPFGVTLAEVLREAGADDAVAVQMGGAAGIMVGPTAFDRRVCYDDLATGGSLMVFGAGRDLLDIAAQFMRFFVHESCGYCTPCRVGTVLVLQRLEDILAGRGQAADVAYLRQLGETMRLASRCGLGQTAANPVLSTLDAFPEAYERRFVDDHAFGQPRFDIQAALEEASGITGRSSVHFPRSGGQA